jgi:hypothetical protein
MSRMNEEAYQVPPFTGLNISVSQLEQGQHLPSPLLSPTPLLLSLPPLSPSHRLADERHRIMRLVESNGGKFGKNLEINVTTHLLCLRPEGEKYSAARDWRSVKIVSVQWIDDCVKKQSESIPSLPLSLPPSSSDSLSLQCGSTRRSTLSYLPSLPPCPSHRLRPLSPQRHPSPLPRPHCRQPPN